MFSPVFLMTAILTGVKWYFIVILILISMTISDVELIFMCLLAICMFWKKYLFRSLAHVLIKLVGFHLVLNFMTSWLFWIMTPYWIHGLQVFSSIPYVFCFFFLILLMVSFTVEKLFSLMASHLFIFAFVALVLGVKSKNIIVKSKKLIPSVFF